MSNSHTMSPAATMKTSAPAAPRPAGAKRGARIGLAMGAADRVFLTPRVVDARSFEELSASLRSIVDRAELITGDLNDAVSRAESTVAELKSAARKYDERLSLGAKLFESIRQRADDVQQLARSVEVNIDHLNELRAAADDERRDFRSRLAADSDEAINKLRNRRESMDREFEEAADAAKRQIARWNCTAENLNARLDSLEDEIQESARPAVESLNELIRRAETFLETREENESSLQAFFDRADLAREQAGETARQAEQIRRECEDLCAHMNDERNTASGLVQHLAEQSERLQSTIDAAAGLTLVLETQAETVERQVNERIESRMHLIDEEVEHHVARIKSMKSEVVGASIELDQRMHACRDLMDDHRQFMADAQSTLDHLNRWERMLVRIDNSGVQIPDDLQNALVRTRETIDSEFDRIRERFSVLAARVDEVVRTERIDAKSAAEHIRDEHAEVHGPIPPTSMLDGRRPAAEDQLAGLHPVIRPFIPRNTDPHHG